MPEVVPLDPARRRTTKRPKPARPRGADLAHLIDSWQLALEAAEKSPKTVRAYVDTARKFLAWLHAQEHPTDVEQIEAPHVRRFLLHVREHMSAASAAHHYRNLSVLWRWLIEEGERTWASPVHRSDRPQVPRKARQYLSNDEIKALLKTCAGRDFESRRDEAIIRILVDNGVRVSGLAGIKLEDVDLRGRKIRVRLKGGNEHWAPIGAKTAAAVDRYLRVRAGHRRAHDSPWLWLGVQGRGVDHFTDSGIRAMLRRRGQAAGIDGVHPHRFRGTFAHEWLRAGGSEQAAMAVAGWKSRAMLDHYTAELAGLRAREEHARLSPGDRI